jgi:hypothetical protein
LDVHLKQGEFESVDEGRQQPVCGNLTHGGACEVAWSERVHADSMDPETLDEYGIEIHLF